MKVSTIGMPTMPTMVLEPETTDEAFELGEIWGKFYTSGSVSRVGVTLEINLHETIMRPEDD